MKECRSCCSAVSPRIGVARPDSLGDPYRSDRQRGRAGVWFFGARYAGLGILEKRTNWAVNVERADRLLNKWETAVIVGARFIPGFSSTATIAVALSNVSSSRFLVLNAIGAAMWALSLGVVGYALGQAVKSLLGDIGRYEGPVAVVLLVAAIVWIVGHHARLFRRGRPKAAGVG